MKIRVSERHIHLRSEVRQGIKDKLEGLERYFDRIISIDAMVEKQKDHFIVRLVAHVVRKKTLKAESQELDLSIAANTAIDNLKTQIVRFKDQLTDHHREDVHLGEVLEGAENPLGTDNPDALSQDLIVRTEVHLRKPMTVEEALLQLDAYNRDLFLFDDANGGGLRILHRHQDGQVELLEPKF
jgi:putative sigma-54 modulation protein